MRSHSMAGRRSRSSTSRQRYGWAFSIAVPQDVFGNSLSRSVLRWRAARARCSCWRCVGAVWVARRIERPMYALQAAARSLERGELVKPQRPDRVESDEVAPRWRRRAEDRALAGRARGAGRCGGAADQGRAAAAVAKPAPRGARPADRRRRPRLQQPARGDRQQHLRAAATRARAGHGRASSAAIARAVQVGSRLTGHLLRFARRSVVKPEVIDLSLAPAVADRNPEDGAGLLDQRRDAGRADHAQDRVRYRRARARADQSRGELARCDGLGRRIHRRRSQCDQRRGVRTADKATTS